MKLNKQGDKLFTKEMYYFVLHHAIFNPTKSGNLIAVLYASAKATNSSSLNDKLQTGSII